MLFDTITFVEDADWNYDLSASTLSTPSDNDVIMRFKAVRDFKFPTNLAGSVAEAETAPSSTVTLTLYRIPAGSGTGSRTSIGTFQIDTNGEITGQSLTEVTITAGQMLELEIGTANSIDEIFVTLKTLAPA